MAPNRQIIFILALGLVLRLVLINQSLWLDEAISVLVAKNNSFDQIVTRFSPSDFHPPLYYFFLKIWGNLFGFSEISVRLPSVIFALLTIYTTFLIARYFSSRSPTFPAISALLLATNPLHIYYSQEARMYSLSALLATVIILFYLRLAKHPNIANIIFLALAVTLSLYTFYPLIFLIIFIALHSLITGKVLKPTAISICLGLLTFFPWLPILSSQLNSAQYAKTNLPLWFNIVGKTSLRALVLVWVKFIIGRISFYTKKGYITYVFISSLVPVYSLFISWTKKKELSLIWGWLFLPLLLLAFQGFVGSGFAYFRLLFVLPAFCLLIAFGLTHVSRSWSRFALLAILASFLTAQIIFWLKPRHHREDWRSTSKYIASKTSDSTATLFVNIGQADPYRYYDSSGQVYSKDDWPKLHLNHIFLMRYVQPIFDPQDSLRIEIESSGFTKVDEKDFNGVTVWEYRKL